MISAALEAQRRSGRADAIRSRDTVLVDDDAVNVRVANDCGVVAVHFDPQQPDVDAFCTSIRRLHARAREHEHEHEHNQQQQLEPSEEPAPLRTPSKKPRAAAAGVKLVAKEHKFLAAGTGSGARRRLGSAGARTSTFNMCTPSPVMKLKCSVDMGRPRSKRATRMLKNYRREMEAALPVVAEAATSTFSVAEVPTTPTKRPTALSDPAETRALPASPIAYKQ
ncbi:unnamed protein product [Phytophthora fragariaefolia]|uniref:Unnamed protein product n=1 Tax=Phytophthora fragariaefolia TaxID=1490495 RepID=A0A9W7CSQ6_9STRA|nr:unnamed protein product [Phytophthora fragariaefolia]